jgi:hypothetical protein
MLLSSQEVVSYLLDAEVDPVAKASVATRREDDRVEAVEEQGIFQLLDRLEEVTKELTSRCKIELQYDISPVLLLNS